MRFEEKRLKFCVAEPICNGIGEPSEHDNPEWPRYIRITDIAGPRRLRPDTFRSLPPLVARQAMLRPGDLVLAAVGATFGKGLLFREPIPACYAGYLVKVRASADFLPEYLAYWTESQHYWDQVHSRVIQTTIQNFSATKFAELRVPSPSRKEQRAIADFLDCKTVVIDALIENKERLARILAEKRQAMITQFVTKGCEPRATMRISGVKWLGEIPSHWEVLPLRRVVDQFVDYRGRTPTKVDDGVPLITAGAVRDGTIDHKRAPEYMAPEEYDELMRRGLPRKGDLVFTTEAPLGEVALVEDTSVAFAQRIILFRVSRWRMLSEYLHLYFLSTAGRSDIESRASGSTAEGIRADRLRASAVLVPPLSEQARIVQEVAKGIRGIEPLRAQIRSSLDTLREYRQTLITAAVTGQLDIAAQEAA